MKLQVRLFCLLLVCSCSTIDELADELPEPDPYRFYPNQSILKDYWNITVIDFDKDSTAWVGTCCQGIVKYSTRETVVFDSTNSIFPNSYINDIAIDADNNVYIGADRLYKYDGQELVCLSESQQSGSSGCVQSVAIDSKGSVWYTINSEDDGSLVKIEASKSTVYNPENSKLPDRCAREIAIDAHDNIWVTVWDTPYTSSLLRISGGQWDVFTGEDLGGPIYRFGDIEVNSGGQVCGTVNYVDRPPYIFHEPQAFIFDGTDAELFLLDSLALVHDAMIDDMDNLWITHLCGYMLHEDDTWLVEYIQEPLKIGDSYSGTYNAVTCIAQAKDGNIWLGKGRGIEIIDGF